MLFIFLFAPLKGGIAEPDVLNRAVPSRKALMMPLGNPSNSHPWKARNTASRNKVRASSPITSLPKKREINPKQDVYLHPSGLSAGRGFGCPVELQVPLQGGGFGDNPGAGREGAEPGRGGSSGRDSPLFGQGWSRAGEGRREPAARKGFKKHNKNNN